MQRKNKKKKKIKNGYRIIILFALIICIVFFLKHKNTANDSLEKNEIVTGMSVTMIGGTNMKEQGNMNSCGYIIKSVNGQLIIVDGGRDEDSECVLKYINELGNGIVDHWYITHPHGDHVGALCTLIENNDIVIENLYYSFNDVDWYRQYDTRGFASEERMINLLDSEKIKNKVSCEKGQIIRMDNIDCEIIRIANPEITKSDNGNDSSMVFKMNDLNAEKSMIFLGDAYNYASIELLKEPEKLKANAVQMAHHGQNGVTKEVYEAIKPEICFFNAPEWLYNNDNGKGYNSGEWQSVIVREWVKELGAQSLVAFEGDVTVVFKSDGYEIKR